MTTTFPWDQFDRVTFEKGICIRKYESGEWFYANSEHPVSVPDPDVVLTSLGVRPVLAEGPYGNERVSFLLPAVKGRLLEIYRDELDLPQPIKFLMGAMLHHCAALARLYAEECAGFVAQWPGEMAGGDNPAWEKRGRVNVKMEAPFFIFEALLTKIIVGFEYVRFPIWRKYDSGSGTPRNFGDTIERCNFSSRMGERARFSWEHCYLPAKKFRNCIHRCLDIGSTSWCRFEKQMPSLCIFMARLPDNPEEKSAGDFRFEQELDALSVAWEYVSEFFAMTDILLGGGELSSASV
jgi:hypothetical protein